MKAFQSQVYLGIRPSTRPVGLAKHTEFNVWLIMENVQSFTLKYFPITSQLQFQCRPANAALFYAS